MAKKWDQKNRINRQIEVATSIKGGGRGRQYNDIKAYEENLARISGGTIKRAKPIKTVKRFVVGWGRDRRNNNRIAFFIQHKQIQGGRRIPTDPKDLTSRLIKFATQLDGGKPKGR